MAKIASVRKRSDGNYQRSITVGRKPDGKPIRKTFYAKTIKELEKKAAEYEKKLESGTLSSGEKITFGDFSANWLATCKPKLGENARRRYKSVLHAHLVELNGYKLIELKPMHLQAIINRMAENGYAEKTCKEVKITAAQILDVAMQNDIVYRNVFAKVTVPHIESEERRPLTEEERKLIRKTCTGHRMGIPAMLMMFCGLRRGEMMALRWGDINLHTMEITVDKSLCFVNNASSIKPPKSKAGTRKVPIPKILLAYLQGDHAADEIFFPMVSGGYMTQIGYNRAWSSYLHYLNIQAGGRDASRSNPKVQKIENITAHMLRHTYATMLYDAGVDIKTAQRYLGHADVQTTLKIYTHLSETKQAQSLDALNAHFDALDAE